MSRKLITITLALGLLAGLTLGLPGNALAQSDDCTPDGTINDDTITCPSADDNGVSGAQGNDTITVEADAYADSVNGDFSNEAICAVPGQCGNDEIINQGNVLNDIKGGGGDDTVTLQGENSTVGGQIDGGSGTDTLNFNMSTDNETQYNNAQAVIAGGGDGNFAWGAGTITWANFEVLVDQLQLTLATAAPAGGTDEDDGGSPATIAYADVYVSVVNSGGTLQFYGDNGGSDYLMASLSEFDYSSASAGQVLVSANRDELGVLLYVVALGDGRLSVQYYSTADGSLLSSTVITV